MKDAAAQFINFFTNDTDCFDIVGIDRAMPISSVVLEYITPSLDETSQKIAAYLDYLDREWPDLARLCRRIRSPAAKWKR